MVDAIYMWSQFSLQFFRPLQEKSLFSISLALKIHASGQCIIHYSTQKFGNFIANSRANFTGMNVAKISEKLAKQAF